MTSWVLFTLIGGACGTTIDMHATDADVPDAPVVETRFVEIEGELEREMVYGETVELRVRYLDEDRSPLAGETVRFNFDGRAHDSSLSAVEVTTDDLGLARVMLTAGTTGAAFRVRASGANAAPVFFLIAISDSGFGHLSVSVAYEGERDVRSRGVGIFPLLTCGEVTPRERGDRFQWIGPDETEVTFLLGAGQPMAVVGRGEGPAGDVLAYTCIDGVQVEHEGQRMESLTIEDLPLVVEGSYGSTLTMDASRAGQAIVGDVLGLAGMQITEGGGGAVLILDAAQQSLMDTGKTSAAQALDESRDTDGVDDTFSASLRSAMVGPQVALLRLDQLLRPQIEAVAIEGVMRVSEEEPGASFQVESLMIGPMSSGPELLDLSLDAELVAYVDATSNKLILESLQLELSASDLVRAVLLRLAEENEDGAAVLARLSGCDLLPEAPSISDSCDADCLRDACGVVAAGLLSSLEEALFEIDTMRAQLEINGEVPLEDRNADRRVDSLTSILSGTWAGSVGEAARLSVELSAERIVPPG